MKTIAYIWVGLMMFALTFLAGCEDNDPTPSPSQTWDVDVYVESSGCLNESFDGWENMPDQGPKHERMQIYGSKNNVSFTHHNVLLNCESEINVEIKIEGDTIFINEKDTAATSAKCECPYRLSYSVILEEDGIYSVKLNDEEPFDFTFEADRYSDTTVIIRPYEGPEFYEGQAIWDFSCYSINFVVTDIEGNDLLDPQYAGNILKNNITITYNNQTFKNDDIKLRYLLPEELAIRKTYSEYLKKHLLTFGEFTPVGSYKNESFTIDWGDGTKDVVKFDLYIEWPNIYTPRVYRKLYLDEEEVAIENYDFVINLVK